MRDYSLQDKFPDLTPVSGAPSLFLLNGCGLTLYGSRDHDGETASYVTTHVFCLLFVPIFALKSLRVVDTQSGQALLGREPLSGLAKTWNGLIALGIVCAVGATWWNSHANSPAYIAHRKMEQAERLAATGEVVLAAQLYNEVLTQTPQFSSGVISGIEQLLGEPLQAAEANDAAEALAVVVGVVEAHEAARELNSHEAALRLAEGQGVANPEAALAALDAVAPIVPDREVWDLSLRPILTRIITAVPNNLAAASKLAAIYETEGDIDRCLSLLEPHVDQLADTEGARILGQIYAQQGKLDEGHALLLPYTEARLSELHAAEKEYESVAVAAQQRVVEVLRNGEGPQWLYNRLQAADEEEGQRLINDHIQSKIKDDPKIAGAQRRLLKAATVTPAAISLGIVLLRRAQGMTDPDARQKELEKAERIFLAVRGMAGESDQYRLSLGQVYYWLGKQEQGRELFDQVIAESGRSSKMLLTTANLLRSLGASEESRKLAEEAHAAASNDEERHAAAALRGLTPVDVDDQIKWLTLAGPADVNVRATLAKSQAAKAARAGDDQKAVKLLRECIKLYSSLPESDSSLNNASLAHMRLFEINGDTGELDRAAAMVEKALSLNPSDSILLLNAGRTILESGLREVVVDQIDLGVLRREADLSLLSYLFANEETRGEYVERVRANAKVNKAVEHLEQALVVSPKQANVYDALEAVHTFLDDAQSLSQLSAAIEHGQPDLNDNIRMTLDVYHGNRDDELRQALGSEVARRRSSLDRARKIGGVTFAVAACSLADTLGQSLQFSAGDHEDEMVRLTEEAFEASPSQQTFTSLVSALCFRANRTLTQEAPEYAKRASGLRRAANPRHLLAAALEQEGLREKMLANADVKRAVVLLENSLDRFPHAYNVWSWRMLQEAGSDDAAWRAAQFIRQDEAGRISREVQLALNPASVSQAVTALWASQIDEKISKDEAAAALKRSEQLGAPAWF